MWLECTGLTVMNDKLPPPFNLMGDWEREHTLVSEKVTKVLAAYAKVKSFMQ